MSKPINWYVVKADRISAWVLFFCVLLYFLTGYGMTQGFASGELAVNLHNKILPPITVAVFVIHSFIAIRCALMRWKWWSWGKYVLPIFYLILLGLFAFVAYGDKFKAEVAEKISEVQGTEIDDDDEEDGTSATSTTATSQTAQSAVKTFTVSELAQYSGKNGQPAYVAVDGDVYDMTRLFANGLHYSHFAGKDLTNAFYSQHAKSKIAKYPIVGKLQ